MSKRIFNEEQIRELLQNPNVERCSDKSISFRKEFKISAVKKYYEGLSPSEILRQAELDINTIGRDEPERCLRRWRNIFNEKGEAGFEKKSTRNNLWRKTKKIIDKDDKEKIKRLETEMAYLKAENRFLASLRKKSLN